jgi:hypothetical protein
MTYGIVIKFTKYSDDHPVPRAVFDDNDDIILTYQPDNYTVYMQVETEKEHDYIDEQVRVYVGTDGIESVTVHRIYPAGGIK